MKSKTYTQNKQPLDKTQTSKFCQLGVKRTRFQNLKKKKEVIFDHSSTLKARENGVNIRSILLNSDVETVCRLPLSWVETHFDPTAVHNLGRHSSNRMPHEMFADCDLSPLCPAHSFIVIPLLLSEPTQR